MNYFFRRMRFLTHSKVQLQFASMFLLWFVVLLATFVLIFFATFQAESLRTNDMQIHDQLITKMLLVEQIKHLALWYGLAAFFYIVLTCIYVLAFSHRMTGPVYKLTKILEKAAKDREWPKNITFRKTDAFPELAVAFNQYCEAMQEAEKSRK